MLSQAAQDLIALAELMGIPVATTHVAHGTFPSAHPLSLGVVGNPVAGSRGRIANKSSEEADVLLVVGTRMDGRTTRGYTLIPPPRSSSRSILTPGEIGSHYPVEVGLVADAKLALEALKTTLARKRHATTVPRRYAEGQRDRRHDRGMAQ